jgi:hypothetical protein
VSEYEQPLTTTAKVKLVFRAWEWLRVWYNLILVVIVLFELGPGFRLLALPAVWIDLGMYAIAANIVFFAGPAVESYLTWLGVWRPWARGVLFVGGCVLSAALAFWITSWLTFANF